MTRTAWRGAWAAGLLLLGGPAAAQVGGQSGQGTGQGASSAQTGAAAATAAGQAATPATPQGQTGTSGTAVANELAAGESLTLIQCLKAALRGSRDLLLARTQLALAEANVSQAWSVIRPQAGITGNVILNDQEVTIPFGDNGGEVVVRDRWQYQASGRVNQILFDGRAIPTLYQLYAVRDAQELSNERLRTEVLFAVSTSFYGTLALQEAVAVTRRQVAERTDQLEATRARFEVGELNKVDLLRAEIDLTTAQQDLVAAEAGLASSKVTLATLIGRPDKTADFSLVRPPHPALEETPVEAQVERAVEARRDLEAARKRVEAAAHRQSATRLSFLPSLSVGWQGNYSSAAGFQGDNFTWQGLLTLQWDLLNGGQRFAEIQQANIQRRQAELTRDGLQDNIEKEVRQARLDLQSAVSNLAQAEATARLAAENAGLVQARYDAGLATSLDLTDANTRRFEAETNEVRQRLNVEVALLRLARAIGVFDAAVPALLEN